MLTASLSAAEANQRCVCSAGGTQHGFRGLLLANDLELLLRLLLNDLVPDHRANRSLENEDIVVWHSFGPTHIPRTEDWPIMPVDYSGFWFKPHGFLDQNPAMDLPDWSSYERSTGSTEPNKNGNDGNCCAP